MPCVLVTPIQFRKDPSIYAPIFEAAGLEYRFPKYPPSELTPPRLIEELKGIEGVLASTEPYIPEVFANSKLRVVARAGVGFDSVDVKAATAANIVVTITPGAVEASVAEHTLAMILAVYRDVVNRDAEVRAGQWTRRSFPRLSGKTLGLVGMGRIGRQVVSRAKALGLKLMAHDPFADVDYAAAQQIQLVSLEELFRTADIISLHAPCTPETTNLINATTLAQMKPDAVLINTSRGGLVDEQALFEAMNGGHLMGAGLDVFKAEPLPADSPLTKLKNVVLTTHTAGLDWQSEQDMARFAAQNLADLYQGKWPEASVVNKDLAGKWKW